MTPDIVGRILAGATAQPRVQPTTPEEVLEILQHATETQHLGEQHLGELITWDQLGHVVATTSGLVIVRQAKSLGAFAKALTLLPSRMKWLPFGHQGGTWI